MENCRSSVRIEEASGDRLQEWRKSWRTLLCASLAYPIAGLGPNVLGIVMTPLQKEFGWSRATISAGMTIVAIMTLLLAPLAGRLISIHGPRAVALVSIVTTAIAHLVIASSGGMGWTWICAWILLGFLGSAVGAILWTTGITQSFSKDRGLALALAMSCNGLVLVLLPPVAVFAIEFYTWRYLFVGFAFVLIFFYLPLTWFLFLRQPVASKQRKGMSVRPAPVRHRLPARPLKGVLRDPGFWLLALFAVMVGSVEGSLLVHLFPILIESGLSTKAAATTASAIGVTLVIGRLTSGLLMDRISPTIVAAVEVALILGASILAQNMLGSSGAPLLIAVALGLGCGGTASAIAILVSRRFEAELYAPVFGVTFGIFAVSYGTGPTIVSYVRDTLGSYGPVYPVLHMLLFFAITAILLLGRVRSVTQHQV